MNESPQWSASSCPGGMWVRGTHQVQVCILSEQVPVGPLVVSFFCGIHVGGLAASSTLLRLGTNATTDFNYGTCILPMVYWG